MRLIGSPQKIARLSVKVGDLVRCVAANNAIGLIVKASPANTDYWVLIGDNKYPFRKHQLKLVYQSRRFGGESR